MNPKTTTVEALRIAFGLVALAIGLGLGWSGLKHLWNLLVYFSQQ